MRSSTVVILALAAAAVAAPIEVRQKGAAPPPAAASGGKSAALGTAANAAGLTSSLINIGNFISGLFGGDDAARREFHDFVARELDLDLEARAGFSSALGKVSNIAGIGSLAATLLGGLFGGGDEQAAREFTEFVTRELEAREIPVDLDARAGFSSALGKVSNIAGIGSLAATLLGGLFGGNDQARREFTDLMTRHLKTREVDVDLDARAGFSSLLGKASNIAGIGSLAATLLGGLFGGGDDAAAAPARRELEQLIARELEVRAGFSAGLGKVANIAGLGSLAATLLGGLFGGGDDAAAAPARRELEQLITRELEARAGFSAGLGKVANIAGLGSLAATLLGGLFGGGDDAAAAPARRELEQLIARELNLDLDARAGFSSLLGKASNIAGIGSLAATLLGGLFGGGDDAAAAPARRELEEFLTRELNLDLDARAGFSSGLGKVANIAGIGSLAATLLGGLFGGGDDAAAATREIMEEQIYASLSRRAIADLD